TIARSAGPMAQNATLRLTAFCGRALRDATAAAPRSRRTTLAMCLYPLWDADPAPYLDPDPGKRPPPPDPRAIGDAPPALDDPVARWGGRLAALGARLYADDEAAIRAAVAAIGAPPDPRALGVPMLPTAAPHPYDDEPLSVTTMAANDRDE